MRGLSYENMRHLDISQITSALDQKQQDFRLINWFSSTFYGCEIKVENRLDNYEIRVSNNIFQ